MNTEQKFGLVNQQFGIIYDAIKNTQADVNSLSANTPALDQLSDVNINSVVNGDTIVYNSTTSEWVNSATSAEVPLTFSTGLTRTTNTITNNLSTGVASGQTAIGGTGVTDILKLKGTTGNGTSGSPAIQAIVGNNGATTALTVLNSGNVGIGTSGPAYPLDVNGSAKFTTIRDSTNSLGTSGQVLSSTSSALSWITPFALPTLTGLSGDAIVSDGSGNIKVSITGNNNYSSGATAFISRTTGTQSTAVGVEALRLNTSGNSNVGVGFQALTSNLGGFNNVAVGTLALVNNTGNTNTSIGHHSLFNNTSGSNNSAIGTDAGKFIADATSANSTGSNSVFLGANTKASANLESNQVVIGHNAIGNGTNSITLGNSLITKTIIPYGSVGIGTTAPTNILSLGNASAQKFWIENTATDVSGRALTVAAGGTVAGTSVNDVSGGQLILQSGSGTGTGDSSIAFQTATTLITGTTLQTMSTKMTILGNGNVGIGTTAPTSKLHIEEPSTTTGSAGINVQKTGVTSGNSYGVLAQTTGAGVTNYGGFFTASGATNNYGLVVSAGNVGIGTTAPSYKLQIRNDVAATTSLEPTTLGLYNNSDGGAGIEFLNSVGGKSKIAFGVESSGVGTDDTYLGFSTCVNALALAERMRITSAGNVGIGTITPSAVLDVYAGSSTSSVLWGETIRNEGNGNFTNYGAGLKLKISSDGEPYKWAGIAAVAGTSYSNRTDLALYTAATSTAVATEKVRITGDGNVGIGTTTPDQRLHLKDSVNGFVGIRLEGSNGSVPSSNYSGADFTIFASSDPQASSNDFLGFQNNSTADSATVGYKMVITKLGNVGIGTTTPEYRLDINSAATYKTLMLRANAIGTRYDVALDFNAINSLTSSYARIGLQVTTASVGSEVAGLTFWTINSSVLSEKMCITAAGNVGIGTITPLDLLHLTATSSTAYDATVDTGQYGSGAGITITNLSTTVESFAQINMQVSSSSGRALGRIVTICKASATSDMAFITENGNVKSEKMRITSTGDVLIGSAVDQGNWKAQVTGNMFIRGSDTTSTDGLYMDNSSGIGLFRVRNDGLVGFPKIGDFTTGSAPNAFIATSGSNGIYTSTSSIRYKKDIISYDKGLNIIKQLKPVYYKSKSSVVDGDKQFAGFIAEDIHDLGLTEFVTYLEGDTAPNSVAYQNMVVLLTKAMQEQQALIVALTASVNEQRERIAVLESK